MKKDKVTLKNKYNDETIKKIFMMLCHVLTGEKVDELFMEGLKQDLLSLYNDIRRENIFADENPTGSTYGSAGSEARRRVKRLQKLRKEKEQLISMFEGFIKQKKKTQELYLKL